MLFCKMSFADYLKNWEDGNKELGVPVRYSIKSDSNNLQNCEVLHHGVVINDDDVVNECNVSWVRDETNNVHACLIIDEYVLPLTTKQCDAVWGARIRSPNFHLEHNSQRLGNGITVPLIPPEYLNSASHRHQAKRRRLETQRRLRKSAVYEMNRVLWHFCIHAEPTQEECTESISVLPPDIFHSDTRSAADVVAAERRETTNRRDRVIAVLTEARDQILLHPIHAAHLETSCLDQLRSVDDIPLLSIQHNGVELPIASHLLAIFNLLFPKK